MTTRRSMTPPNEPPEPDPTLPLWFALGLLLFTGAGAGVLPGSVVKAWLQKTPENRWFD